MVLNISFTFDLRAVIKKVNDKQKKQPLALILPTIISSRWQVMNRPKGSQVKMA